MIFRKTLQQQIKHLERVRIPEIRQTLRQAKLSEPYITDILNDIQTTLAYLKHLDREYKDEATLDKQLRYLFKIRWAAIKKTSAAYVESPFTPANLACEQLAIAIAKPNEPVAQILMHTIKANHYENAGESLQSLTENPDRTLAYHKFIISHDEKAIIPLKDWVGLHDRQENKPFLYHMYRVNSDGQYQIDPTRYHEPRYCDSFVTTRLSPEDLSNLKQVSASFEKYIDGIIQWENKSAQTFTPHLRKLCQDCLDNGVSSRKKNDRGAATDSKPHPDVYPLIREFLTKWFALSGEERDRIGALRDSNTGFTLSDHILVFRSTAAAEKTDNEQSQLPALTEEENQKRIANNIHTCVEINAAAVTVILDTNSVDLTPLIPKQTYFAPQPTPHNNRYQLEQSRLANNMVAYGPCLYQDKINNQPHRFNLYYQAGCIATHMPELNENNEFALQCALNSDAIDLVKHFAESVDIKKFDNLLSFAVKHKDIDLIILAIKRGVNLDTKINANDDTILHVAAQNNWENVIDACLAQSKFDINARNTFMQPPLFTAAKFGRTSIVKKLIQAKADVSCHTESHFEALHAAVQYGHLSTVEALIEEGKADINAQFEKQLTPLMYAIQYGHVSIVRVLVEKYLCDINISCSIKFVGRTKRDDRFTALHYAAYLGNPVIMKILLDARKINDIDVLNEEGNTPLRVAFDFHNIEAMRLLILGGANFSGQYNKKSLLDWAINLNYRSLIGAIIPKISAEERKEYLKKACSRGWPHVAKACLSADFFLAYPPKELIDLLLIAINKDHFSVAKELVLSGVNLTLKPDKNTLMHILFAEGQDVIEACHKQKVNINLKNHLGMTPLMCTVENNHTHITDKLLACEDIDLTATNLAGNNVLHIAVLNQDLSVIEHLLGRNLDFNARNKNEMTALHMAANQQDKDAVAFLLTGGADINLKTKTTLHNKLGSDCTALHIAAFHGATEMVETMLQVKTLNTLEDKNSNGYDALHLAAINHHRDVIRHIAPRVSFDTLIQHPKLHLVCACFTQAELFANLGNHPQRYALILAQSELLQLRDQWVKLPSTRTRIVDLERNIVLQLDRYKHPPAQGTQTPLTTHVAGSENTLKSFRDNEVPVQSGVVMQNSIH